MLGTTCCHSCSATPWWGAATLRPTASAACSWVQGAFVEDGQEPTRVASELAAELRLMQAWLELASIEVADRGELAPLLRRSL